MGRRVLSQQSICVEETTNLDGVTSATTGSKIDCRWYNRVSVQINCSVNTGAVTVTIQASVDGTNWHDLNAKTYTGATGVDLYKYTSYYPYIRTKTSTQSNSTVTTFIAGRS